MWYRYISLTKICFKICFYLLEFFTLQNCANVVLEPSKKKSEITIKQHKTKTVSSFSNIDQHRIETEEKKNFSPNSLRISVTIKAWMQAF